MTIKVLYIIGKGRSGSTLLDRLLGEIDSFVSTGELWRIWDKGVVKEEHCGCGTALPQCPFWNAIIPSKSQAQQIIALQNSLLRWRKAPLLLHTLRETSQYKQLVRHYADLYQHIQKRSAARVIVDSSKWPLHPGVLGDIPGVTPYIVHLIRHPYAVAHSWRKQKRYTGSKERQWMLQFPLWHSGLSWSVRNTVADLLVQTHQSALRLQYEYLVDNPEAAIHRIVDLVGETVPNLNFIRDEGVRFSVHHTVGGNPNRFQSGPVRLKSDDVWQAALSSTERRFLYLFTAIPMWHFGYHHDTN